MRRSFLSLATAGLAVLVLAGSVAAAGPYAPDGSSVARRGGGGGAGAGYGGGGTARGPISTVTVATLTADQAADLLRMAEDEKLAYDLYTAFAAKYGDATFAAIASSEANHLSRVRTLLARYGIADVTAGLAPGVYADTEVQALYDQLVADGSASLEAAWAVGKAVEVTDIADLDGALASGTLPRDVSRVYANLRNGSTHHLAAFEALLAA